LLPQEKNAFTGMQDIKVENCSNYMKCCKLSGDV